MEYKNLCEERLKQLKLAQEFLRDFENSQKCNQNVRFYERNRAWNCLQEMIKEYRSQIDAFGKLFDRIHVIQGVLLEQISDEEIVYYLRYISAHIPAYILLREGEKEFAERMFCWLGQGNHYLR